MGKKSLILEPTAHIGGLPANGLGLRILPCGALPAGYFLVYSKGIATTDPNFDENQLAALSEK